MSVCFIMDFPGARLDQYDQVMERMDLGGELPPGALFHVVGLTGDGLRVVDVWESDEAFQRFAETQIGPHTAAVGIEEPAITRVPVHRTRDERGSDDGVAFFQVVRLPGLDAAGFDAADAQIVIDDVSPEGLVFHIAGPVADGFLVADVWSSKSARDAFLESSIRPVMERTELAGPPSFDDSDVHNTLGARTRTAA
jgi:hypothetical protein